MASKLYVPPYVGLLGSKINSSLPFNSAQVYSLPDIQANTLSKRSHTKLL